MPRPAHSPQYASPAADNWHLPEIGSGQPNTRDSGGWPNLYPWATDTQGTNRVRVPALDGLRPNSKNSLDYGLPYNGQTLRQLVGDPPAQVPVFQQPSRRLVDRGEESIDAYRRTVAQLNHPHAGQTYRQVIEAGWHLPDISSPADKLARKVRTSIVAGTVIMNKVAGQVYSLSKAARQAPIIAPTAIRHAAGAAKEAWPNINRFEMKAAGAAAVRAWQQHEAERARTIIKHDMGKAMVDSARYPGARTRNPGHNNTNRYLAVADRIINNLNNDDKHTGLMRFLAQYASSEEIRQIVARGLSHAGSPDYLNGLTNIQGKSALKADVVEALWGVAEVRLKQQQRRQLQVQSVRHQHAPQQPPHYGNAH